MAKTSDGQTLAEALRIPPHLLDLLGPTAEEQACRIRELVAVELFRREEISGGKVREILGLSWDQFMDLLREQGVPYLDLSEEELRKDLETALAFRLSTDVSSPRTQAAS
jgi:predicted HTH domain antitoxin